MNNPTNLPSGLLQVLFLAAEADPLIKIGGLADVAGSLPQALRALNPDQAGGNLIDARVVLPYYGAISLCPEECIFVASFPVRRGEETIEAKAFLTEINGIPFYLISGAPIDPQAPVYSLNPENDGEKFTFFSLAALELARAINWKPDVVHANDWHTAPAVYALGRSRADDDFYAYTRTVLTIHNTPFMGAGTGPALAAYGLPPSDDPALPDWARHFPLPMGLAAADEIVAVSPTYAREILTAEYGSGLDGFFRTRLDRLTGILNGLPLDNWDPATDTTLAQPFSADNLAARTSNKLALLNEFSLRADPNLPLLVLISRMDPQKGVDLAVEALRQMADEPWQAIFLGTGEPYLEDACRRLEAEFPDRVRAAIIFNSRLSRRMYAGADMLMMPSRYEPCGLAQMIAMRYGCVPVARAVGGLRDTVIDDPDVDRGTGFLFEEATPQAFAAALKRALREYAHRKTWQARQRNCMQQDFSWTQSAIAYANLYQRRLPA